MIQSRYKFFDDVWNNNKLSYFKGLPTDGFFTLFTTTTDDILYTIPKQFEYRPDLIANTFYGSPKLYWILIYANGFNNSPEDFAEGVTIRIPSYKKVIDLL